MTYKVSIDGHEIEIWFSLWSGKERVSYDGELKSEKRSFVFETVHSFQVQEDGEDIVYEVNVASGIIGWGYAIRRNGIIKAHKP